MWWMLEVTLKATAVLAASGFISVLLRKASAATRHLVWSMGIVAALLVPILSLVAPRWSVPITPVDRWQAPTTTAIDERAADARPAAITPLEDARRYPTGEDLAGRPSGVASDLEHQASAAVLSAAITSPSPQVSLGFLIGLVWSIGAMGSMAIVLFSVFRIGQIDRRAAPIHDRRIMRIADRLTQRKMDPVERVFGDRHPDPHFWK